jgi:4-aminobutyrate aminotransferase-like enzyme
VVCPFFLNEGFPGQKEGWLQAAAEVVSKAGGLLVCDEVQSGFGRIGSHFWAHQKQGVVPDIVVMGKPMANGHPVGAVVTSAGTMASFRNHYRYFNTFGGNPVSCAAALAVLDELESRELMQHAERVGNYALQRLEKLQAMFACVGDVRGAGLIFGAEMVLDRESREPATEFTDRLINAMKDRGVVHSKLGRYKNTLKIRPPMPFSFEHADLLFDTLEAVLESTPLQVN